MRPYERRLCYALAPQADNDDVVGLALVDACDRIAESTDTLSHLLRPARHRPASTAATAPAG